MVIDRISRDTENVKITPKTKTGRYEFNEKVSSLPLNHISIPGGLFSTVGASILQV